MNLISNLPEYAKPKNVGLMFFCLEPEKFFPYSMENLKNYRAASRRYRNRRIGEFLKELHLTEGRNTGFQKIIRALKANGSPMPIFETDDDRTYFLTTVLIHPEFTASDEGRNDGRNEGRNDLITVALTDNEQLILNTIRLDEHITMVKMAEQTGLSKATVERVVKAMKEKNIIGREGSTKKGKWIIL